MKKYIKLILIIIPIIVVWGIFYYLFFTPYGNIDTSYRVENFEDYKSYYEGACDEIIRLSKVHDLKVDKGEQYFFDGIPSSTLCCKELISNKVYGDFKITKAGSTNFGKLAESFPKDYEYSFDYICYSKNEICFYSRNGSYAIVYSFDDKEPQHWHSPYETDPIKTKKIQKNWYHVWR